MLALVTDAIRNGQANLSVPNSDGIYFSEFQKEMASLIEQNGLVYDPNMIDICFVDAFVRDEYLSNEDISKVSLIELAGFKKYSQYHEERFKGFDLEMVHKTL